MKQHILLEKGWYIRSQEPAAAIDPAAVAGEGMENWLSVSAVPAEVHDILLEHGKLDPEYKIGWCESAEWVTHLDWIYRLDFDAPAAASRSYLRFGGLDTLADIYLNGALIGQHDDFYVSDLLDVTGKLQAKNTLILHFHNVLDALDAMELPEAWKNLDKYTLIRKSRHYFPQGVTEGSSYQGIVKYHTPIGIYENVELILA